MPVGVASHDIPGSDRVYHQCALYVGFFAVPTHDNRHVYMYMYCLQRLLIRGTEPQVLSLRVKVPRPAWRHARRGWHRSGARRAGAVVAHDRRELNDWLGRAALLAQVHRAEIGAAAIEVFAVPAVVLVVRRVPAALASAVWRDCDLGPPNRAVHEGGLRGSG